MKRKINNRDEDNSIIIESRYTCDPWVSFKIGLMGPLHLDSSATAIFNAIAYSLLRICPNFVIFSELFFSLKFPDFPQIP